MIRFAGKTAFQSCKFHQGLFMFWAGGEGEGTRADVVTATMPAVFVNHRV